MPEPGEASEPPGGASGPAPHPLTPAGPAAAPAAAPAPAPRLWHLAAAGACYAGLLFLFVSLAPPDLFDRAEAEPWTFLWVQLVDDATLAAVALTFARLAFPGSWTALGFRPVRPVWWAIGGASGVGAAALGWVVSAALDALGIEVPAHPVEEMLDRADRLPDLLLVLAAVTVPVAMGEETFFRGYAYRLLRARLGVVAGLLGSSLLFALVHGLTPGAWLPVLPIGLVFGLLVERSGSLVPAMAGHVVVNALAVLTP
jgi:membrane protease YdiL (CAAX protease family)